MTIYLQKNLLWAPAISLILGAGLSFIQPGSWQIGWIGFSVLFIICFSLLIVATRSAGSKTLLWIVALAFILRFAGGVTTFLSLPVIGYVDDEDQSAGFTYTDAHRRDAQAWELAIPTCRSWMPLAGSMLMTNTADCWHSALSFTGHSPRMRTAR